MGEESIFVEDANIVVGYYRELVSEISEDGKSATLTVHTIPLHERLYEIESKLASIESRLEDLEER